MNTAASREWPERLRARHVAPVGVVDTRPFLRRYAQWLEWERRRDAVTGRLLARRGAEGEAVVQESEVAVWKTISPSTVQHEPEPPAPAKPMPGAAVSNVIESPPAAGVAVEPEKTYRIKRAPLAQENVGLHPALKHSPDGEASAQSQQALRRPPEITPSDRETKTRAVPRIDMPNRGVATPSGQDSTIVRHDRARVMRDSPEQVQRVGRLVNLHAGRVESAKDDLAPVSMTRLREDERRPEAVQRTTTQATPGVVPRLAEVASIAAEPRPPDVIWRKPRADAVADIAAPGQSHAPDQAGSLTARAGADSPATPIALAAATTTDASKRESALPAHPVPRLKDVNFQQLVEQVSRQILRKISMDVERRGGRSWP